MCSSLFRLEDLFLIYHSNCIIYTVSTLSVSNLRQILFECQMNVKIRKDRKNSNRHTRQKIKSCARLSTFVVRNWEKRRKKTKYGRGTTATCGRGGPGGPLPWKHSSQPPDSYCRYTAMKVATATLAGFDSGCSDDTRSAVTRQDASHLARYKNVNVDTNTKHAQRAL